ncbi:EAL domain-containing protein [Zestomonas thermotolerans]|uniref:EAL domain-containing protein n=1 Tax=Zestomonas thermotolerans TaxID=157784 RepID=UPI0023F4B540|nr:EAL domain-containing protein [Pseudomonas thermotolerans]
MTAPNLSEILVQTLEQAIDGVVVIDSDNRIILFNRAAEQLWGLGRDEVLGHNVRTLMPPEFRERHDSYIEANRCTGVNRIIGGSLDVPILRADGERRWGSMSISKIQAEGQIIYAAFVKDVTRQYEESAKLNLLSLVVDHTDHAVLITDMEWRTTYVNAGFCRLFGYAQEELIGRTPIAMVAPYFSAARIEEVRRQLTEGKSYHAEEVACTKDGKRIWCKSATNPVFDASGQLTGTVTLLTDITQVKIHEVLQSCMLQAMIQEEPLEKVMELACREVENFAPEVLASVLRVDEEGHVHPLAAPSLPESYSRALDGVPIGPNSGSCGTAAYLGEPVLCSDIEHDPRWADYKHLALPLGLRACWSVPIKSSTGRVLGTFAFYYREPCSPSPLHERLVEVSVHLCALALEREESRSHIRQLAYYDSLTGLPNRSLLHIRAEEALAEVARQEDSLAVLFIDVDRFKQVNDSLGLTAGDELLRVIAERLGRWRQHSDIVSRMSVDEFVLVLPYCGSEQITEKVEQVKSLLTAPVSIAGTLFKPSISIGISLYPGDGQDITSLIHRADMAMSQAKQAERGGFRFYSPELNSIAQERLALENALREALTDGSLQLYYQPQVCLDDGRLYGLEALARWHHPVLGDISPVRFIPLAEDCGLIGGLGLWALREACRQLAEWRRNGLEVPTVAVNLSPTNFHNLELPAFIEQVLTSHGLQPGDLTLEITESVLMDSNPGTLETLHAVHEQGVRLSMDDFGTGYSSLSYLRRLPIQELKLDRSFVLDLEHDATNRALSEAVIRLGESLDLTVVAEGIESEAQHRLLAEQGYHVVQGYLFARPLAAPDLAAWLRARRQD